MTSSLQPLAPGLARKVKKTLELRTDTPDLADSLRTLSTFYTDNSAEQRRLLRSNIERRGLKINEAFLAASETAQQALVAAEEKLDLLSACCERITTALEASRLSTASLDYPFYFILIFCSPIRFNIF